MSLWYLCKIFVPRSEGAPLRQQLDPILHVVLIISKDSCTQLSQDLEKSELNTSLQWIVPGKISTYHGSIESIWSNNNYNG